MEFFEQTLDSHISKKCGCNKCSPNKKSTTDEFIKKAKIIHKSKYDYSLVEYKNNSTKVKIICPEHGVFKQSPIAHTAMMCGCPACAGRFMNLDIFIKKSKQVHGDKYDYSLVEYKSSTSPVKIICKKHGIFEQIPATHINSKCGCQICKESRGEKEIKNFLIKNQIKFNQQKKFNDCKYKGKLAFDFYLVDLNTCIEFDGEFHFNIIKGLTNESTLVGQQKRDNIKTEYCSKNNITLVRIKYDESVEKILTDKLLTKEMI